MQVKVEMLGKTKSKSLTNFEVPSGITNTEAKLYVYKLNEKWNKVPYLFKCFHINEGEYFSDKLYTINTLVDNYETLSKIEELVLPSKLVIKEQKVAGYFMPYYEENINLQHILRGKDVPSFLKVEYLKKVGEILRRIEKLKKLENKFFLGDIHEGNFIYDIKTHALKVVDIDSSKILNSNPFPSKYLVLNKNLNQTELKHKYYKAKNGNYAINRNTDILCYITMILNTISNTKIYNLTEEQYYMYLEYLVSLGFEKVLIDKFSNIYTGSKNISPLEDLCTLPANLSKASYSVFRLKYNLK